jgi:hypothetical protein
MRFDPERIRFDPELTCLASRFMKAALFGLGQGPLCSQNYGQFSGPLTKTNPHNECDLLCAQFDVELPLVIHGFLSTVYG